MKFNRNKHSRFVQWLDRTAEKNPLLWLPCVLLIALALAGEHIVEYTKIAYLHRNAEKIVKERPQLGRKPFALRFVAMSLVVAFGFMFTADLGQIVYADELYDNLSIDNWQNDINIPGIIPPENISNERETDSYDIDTLETSNEAEFEAYSNSDATYGDFTYMISNGEVAITGYNGTDTEVVIPDNIEGLPVTSIGSAFYDCRSLTSIVIPDNVISIEGQAFDYCVNLTTIAIGGNVSNIGSYAFRGCINLKNIILSENNLAYKLIDDVLFTKDGTKLICYPAAKEGFGYVIPDSVSYIEDAAFYGCNIETISIPDSVTYIGDGAFSNCKKITKIVLPNSVTYIGCGALGCGILEHCTELKSVTLPNTLTHIPGNSFYGCTSLTNIEIPDSVTYIGHWAFCDCTNLTSIKIPQNVREIHFAAFENCNSLAQINIPENVTSIDRRAFFNCIALKNVEIPDSVTDLGDDAFANCTGLENAVIGDGVTIIQGEYFYGGNGTFDGCINLKTVVLGKNVKGIRPNAFRNCKSLTNIIIPNSVTSIGAGNFSSCLNLTIYCVPGSYAETYAKGNNIPFKDISEFDNPDIEPSELTATYDYNGRANINNISMYKSYCVFFIPINTPVINNTIEGNIYVYQYDNKQIVPLEPALNIDVDLVSNTVALTIFALNKNLNANTKYYFDLSEVLIDGKPYFNNVNCKEKYNFTTDFGIKFGEQTFNFDNTDKNNFVAFGEKDGYHITPQMYDNEIKPYSFFKECIVKKWIKRDDWGGSCFGMSSTMILANTSRLNRGIPGTWSKPSDTAQIPYGSRDIINYYHIIQDWYNIKSGASDIINIQTIFAEALSINSIDDIFEMSYYYDKNKKSGHSVVVVGAEHTDNGDFLYIYNPNNKNNIEKWPIKISTNDGYNGSVYTTPNLVNVFGIHWMYPYELNKFTPKNIKDNTRIWTSIQNASTIISNQVNNLIVFDDTSYEGTITPKDIRYTVYGEAEPEMLIVLPPENYYEISSSNGTIDYDIANGNMFFAAKTDNAEKSIVSAEDGIKLINASGSFELTVSADESMPYDMFDISGIASGDVDCQYVDNKVVVNLDNTSDTIITFYHDLDTENYTVPSEYDKFIIGEQNNEEAIFVDTDGDGIYETDILEKDVHIHVPAAEYSSDETGHWHNCTLCTEKLSFEAHAPNDGVITLEPTKTTEGIKTYTCTVCSYIRTETIPVITPDHTVHTFGTKWFNDGTYHWHECTICGAYSDKKEHNENNVVVTVQPTTTSTGTKTYSCSVCGCVMRTESIPPTDNPNPPYPVNPTPSYPTITYPTNTSTQITNEPYIYGDTSKSGWDTIISEIDLALDGDTVRVNMNGTTELPKTVVSHIQNRNINLELNMGSTVWTINGLDVTNPQTVNMRISDRYEKIPDSVMDSLYSELTAKQLRLYHSGNFGFTAKISLNVGKRYNGYYATLYYYNTRTKQLEFIDESFVENRQVTFELTHASYYAVAFNSIQMYDDISSGAGVFENSVPIETSAMPETSGVTIPAIKLPQIMKYSNKKRRYHILKKRRLDDLVFVF